MDIWNKEKRSEIMSKVRQKDTGPEVMVRKFLFANGFRFRKNVTTLPGSPDIVLPKYKTVILINGCFWHGHNCRQGRLPSSNNEFWQNKIQNNVNRDSKNAKTLTGQGWHVIIVWLCEIRNMQLREERLNLLASEIMTRT